MIYLTGITIADHNSSNKRTRKFKRIKLPFNTEKELESFICEMSNNLNKRVYPMIREMNKPCPSSGFCQKISINLKTCSIDKKECDKYKHFKINNLHNK